MNKKLYRSRKNKVLAGVCGGIGEYFEVDPVLIRVLFVFLTFFNGSGILLYLLLLIILPQEPIIFPEENYSNVKEEDIKSEYIPAEKPIQQRNTRKIFGIILLILGVVFLINNIIPSLDFEIIFPLILIGIGIYLIMESLKSYRGES